jgi:hypothetical protein
MTDPRVPAVTASAAMAGTRRRAQVPTSAWPAAEVIAGQPVVTISQGDTHASTGVGSAASASASMSV